MMDIVNLDQEIGHRQLQLMRPKPAWLGRRRQSVPRTQEHENISGLRDQHLAGTQKRRREGRLVFHFALQNLH